MKITLELPDELLDAIKMRAADEDRTITDVITELLQRSMAEKSAEPEAIRNRVKLPLVKGAHAASPEEEMTPERVSDILLAQETEAHLDLLR